jgi:crossover junction endodeoxyribonuclease RusA
MELILPWPPSLNSYWRTFNGRMILSEKGRLYRQHVMEQCLLQRVDTFTGPITVEIVAYRPDNRKRDLDNLLKAVLDGMAKGLVYEDDSQIRDLRIRWADTIGGMLKVHIEEAK